MFNSWFVSYLSISQTAKKVYFLLPYLSQTADMGLCPVALPISDSRHGSMSCCRTDFRQQIWVYVLFPYRFQTADMGLCPVAVPISDSKKGLCPVTVPISDSRYGSMSCSRTDFRQQTWVYVLLPYRFQTADMGLCPVVVPISGSKQGLFPVTVPISDSRHGSMSCCHTDLRQQTGVDV